MKRYERQVILPDVGIAGQHKLAKAKVLIIGVGGLGCPVLQHLAGTGVGTIGIVDGDIVDETNLHRQFLYNASDCGRKKVEAAAEVVSRQNPEVRIIQYPTYFERQNFIEIISGYQVIVDCSDTIPARYLINDAAIAKGIPMVYASIHKFEGQLSVFNYKNGPAYHEVFPEDDRPVAIPSCNDSGVLGTLPNVLGAMQANEVLKIILGIGEVLSGKMLLYNSLDNCFQIIEIQTDKYFYSKVEVHEKSIAVENLFATEDALVIDIREEYEEPKLDLKNIKNVPLSQLDSFLKDTGREQKIIMVCQHGNRSVLAADYIIKKGFTNVFHLKNGVESLLTGSDDNR
jgi:sulfur-carrier protein adenylyltransferase/sulfurtransferase